MIDTSELARDRHEGSCQCGAVRFAVSGRPLRMGLCHCLDCRKTSGASFVTFAVWPRDAFESTGKLATHEGRSFCSSCGGRVCSLRPDEAEIMIGSLDAVALDLVPTYEIWVKRREGWLHALPWADQFDEDRTAETGTWRQATGAT